jgi:histidine triad (HIT) family protein
MASIFTKIINKEIPSYKIAENDKFYAFLDVSPLQKGHTLVVPKIEVDYIFDVEDELLSEMIIFAKDVSKKIKSAFPCNRVGMAVIGLEVPHAHIHLIPINSMNDMNFANEKQSFSVSKMKEIQELIVNQ